MAIWQYELTFIPRSSVVKALVNVPPSLALDDEERSSPWADVERTEIEASLELVLARADSWSKKLVLWGSEAGDCIRLWLDDAGAIESVELRADLRHPRRDLLRSVLALAVARDWLLLGNASRRLIPPEANALLDDLCASDAARFVLDPRKFLHDLSSEDPP